MLKVAGDMRRPSMMAILMCVLDVIFNYFLIFPTRTISLFGIELTMPGFGAGVAGAALGSLFSLRLCRFALGLLCHLPQSYLGMETRY